MRSNPSHDPSTYAATKNEVGVFTTTGYSDDIKPLWRFKNAEEAKKSAESIWERFERYRDERDFVGMDICRKFIQMGRTRSLRYALRPGGKKYDPSTGKERKRTGEVYDQGKLDGANIYEKWLDKCWNDKIYKKAWEDWKDGKISVSQDDDKEEEVVGKDFKKDLKDSDELEAVDVDRDAEDDSRPNTSKKRKRKISNGEDQYDIQASRAKTRAHKKKVAPNKNLPSLDCKKWAIDYRTFNNTPIGGNAN
ncbi:uncharacterized protein I206_103356 [Kwoniella pini CBS 10737]|uniref:Uncharacterized protein n=1 Tax=Kwoniella pini CBS 10737 TaxID=1296096 RepID=A0A1B9I9Y9_9TREE|nr:uncharacterized protein I206_01638 [Kwoniella pini CBS 10737]OCF52349.1 hypothetical protein I206_01638 [Kwoniella pini CBS 10737]